MDSSITMQFVIVRRQAELVASDEKRIWTPYLQLEREYTKCPRRENHIERRTVYVAVLIQRS